MTLSLFFLLSSHRGNQVVRMRRGLVYFKYLGTLCDPTQALAFAAPLILGQDKLSGSSLLWYIVHTVHAMWAGRAPDTSILRRAEGEKKKGRDRDYRIEKQPRCTPEKFTRWRGVSAVDGLSRVRDRWVRGGGPTAARLHSGCQWAINSMSRRMETSKQHTA